MNQTDRISTLLEELSEELHAAIHELRRADIDLRKAFPFTWGHVGAPVRRAIDSLERAQRLVGPFEPEHLPVDLRPFEEPYVYADDEKEQARIHSQ